MSNADNLSSPIWNAIADQISRVAAQHEIVFAPVTKVDKDRYLIYVDGFGEMAIPLVGFQTTFAYYDTQGDGSTLWRGDKTQVNTAFQTRILMPKVGDVAVILDLAGTKTYPVCIGITLSKLPFWETD
jgi:hypothetical protein